MADLFGPNPTDNLLPYDGKLFDFGQIDLQQIVDSFNYDCDYSAEDLYQTLLTTLPWQSDIVTLFGKTHITKRQIVWMGDEGLSYRYAGHARHATGWYPIVFHVKQCVEQNLAAIGIAADFNSCLLNYYPSGTDGMGYHADDEKELGYQPIIASLSLGATRKFLLKHKKTQDKVELYLESGQLIVMHGDTQTFWKHTITKTKTIDTGRISLTFRRMLTI